jgi:hypothetical protein
LKWNGFEVVLIAGSFILASFATNLVLKILVAKLRDQRVVSKFFILRGTCSALDKNSLKGLKCEHEKKINGFTK